ncbi:hypothetical protein SAMN05444287_1969 [Octadecabacter temperatus]|uniref:Uncharacterized protein n=1 Tax=Octadecabacter temperatus TaxID=1458307 RepID=A0A0K0Y7F8_9RHOB|nr:hypothetical protein [Octadecabacter temperatus]AKS46845.1 hypothetical protein OSB_23090 [Octadecabacter temperatus]SIO22372.1 hypothetical protein SAMN05444287_1969 [Octadecabacter temperatus]
MVVKPERMTGDSVNKYADEVQSLIEERLRIKGRTLEKALARAGRLLPKWAHREGRYLAQASQLMAHPKLRLMIDEAKAVKARDLLVAHLKSIDPKERRKTRVLGILGVISFNLIIVFAALMAYLLWRGFL